MSTDNCYRVVTMVRDANRVEHVKSVFPPLNEPAVTRDAALERMDVVLTVMNVARQLSETEPDWPKYGPDTLAFELLPTGKARMKVVTDEQARDLAADAWALIGAVR